MSKGYFCFKCLFIASSFLVLALPSGTNSADNLQLQPEISLFVEPFSTKVNVNNKGFDLQWLATASPKPAGLLKTFTGHQDNVDSVAFSPDGQKIVSGSKDHSLKLWNLAGELLGTFKGHQGSVHSVAFSPDGQKIASAGHNNSLELWNLKGELLATLKGHQGWVFSVAFSPDGQSIVSGSKDHSLKLWNLAGELLGTFKGHQDWVFSVAFSPDGQQIVSGSKDRSLKLWNLAGELLGTFKGHQDWVRSVAVSSDGRRIISGSDDRTLKLWGEESAAVAVISSQGKLLTDLQSKAKSYLETIKARLKLAPIAQPELPAIIKEAQGGFESKAEFNARIEGIKSARAQQIASIQTDYQKKVEQRNLAIAKFNRNYTSYRNRAMAQAVIELYGQPEVVPLYSSDHKPKYDPEKRLLYASLTFSGLAPAVFKRTLALSFTDNKQGKGVYQALVQAQEEETMPAMGIQWAYQDNALSLKQLDLAWRNRWITGRYSSDADFKHQPITIALADKSQLDAIPQSTALKDVSFEIYLTEQTGFNDDIPTLLAKAATAPIDLTRWLFAIGAGKYRKTDDILYSRRSAELFAQTAVKVLGIDAKKRQFLLLDDEATSGSIEDGIKDMLAGIRAGDSIYFYYSGHGIPSIREDNIPYLLPVDKSPRYVADGKFFQAEHIYQLMLDSKADKVFAFMDSCFTGKADGNSVFEGIAATRLRPKAISARFGHKMAVLTAGTNKQFSTAYKEKGHRLFSYYLIKALLAKRSRTIGELADKVRVQVTDHSRGQGEFEQTPTLQGTRSLAL